MREHPKQQFVGLGRLRGWRKEVRIWSEVRKLADHTILVVDTFLFLLQRGKSGLLGLCDSIEIVDVNDTASFLPDYFILLIKALHVI